MADLKQLFKTAVASSMDLRGKPAILGKIDGTLYWSSSRRDMVWARVGETSSYQEMVVQCTKVTPQYDMPVRVDMVNGIMSVVLVDEKRYLEFSGNRPGGSVGAHAWLHGRLGPDPMYITGLQYLPLLVVPSNPADLTVTVEQGAYRWDGTYKIFERAASGSLSSYVPGSSAVKHFVIIALDRVNNAIVIVDGDDITGGGDALFGTITLTPDDVTAISIDDTYAPLAAVLLYNGQTEVRAADIVMDLRTWGGEDFVGAVGIPEPTDDGETYGRKTDGTSSWVAVVPAAGGTFSGAVAISSGGLTVEGGAVFNDSGAPVVHRFEGDTNANLLYVDGPNNRVGVAITPAVAFHTLGETRFEFADGQYIALKETSIGGASTIAARNSSGGLQTVLVSGADVGILAGAGTGTGNYTVRSIYDGALKLGFFGTTPAIQQTAVKATTALQNLGLGTSLTDYVAATGGTFSGAVAISSGGLTVEGGFIGNDAGADVDSRIEGDTDVNLTYWDAGNDRVIVGGNTGTAKLHVKHTTGAAGIELFKAESTNESGYFSVKDGASSGFLPLFEFKSGSQNIGGAFNALVGTDTQNNALSAFLFSARNSAGTGALSNCDLFQVDNYTTTAFKIWNNGGITVGTPVGSNKGAGTLNAGALYDDGTIVADHVFDLHYDGRMRPADAERFPKARLWSIEQTAVFTEKNRHLPTMPGRLQWETAGGNSLGRLITALWETVEQQQLMIYELNNKIKAVTNGKSN